MEASNIIKIFRHKQFRSGRREIIRFDVTWATGTSPPTLAVGNSDGDIHVWNLESDWTTNQEASQILSLREANTEEGQFAVEDNADETSSVELLSSTRSTNDFVPRSNETIYQISSKTIDIKSTDKAHPQAGKSSEDAIVIDDDDDDESVIVLEKDRGGEVDLHPKGSAKGVGSETDPIELDSDDPPCINTVFSSRTTAVPTASKTDDSLSTGKTGDESTFLQDHHRKRRPAAEKDDVDSRCKVPRNNSKQQQQPARIYNNLIRQVAFSPDGNIIVACDGGGNIFHWQRPFLCPKTKTELALEYYDASCNGNEDDMEEETHDHSSSDDDDDEEIEDVPLPDFSTSNRASL
ncbi:hypothetical protein IV203_038666 [Nitzschia inconspicua]|uniref:Uncharacterized protein n=1 Tax=Nitzschia inconspicua TaxID=303405 RepID=A0A9K3LP07_9STRA|nr:hypothetical protein IV203_038666 [Nitzschia inconspicua]